MTTCCNQKKVTFEPIGDRVVIQPDDRETKSPGGIVLPDQATEKPQCGTIIAAGPGVRLQSGERAPLQVGEGDRVLFSPYAETVTLQDVEYVLVREGDLLAILR
jgi:chaperonin GroES